MHRAGFRLPPRRRAPADRRPEWRVDNRAAVAGQRGVSRDFGEFVTPPVSGLAADARDGYVVTLSNGDKQLLGTSNTGGTLPLGQGVVVSPSGVYLARSQSGLVATSIDTLQVVWSTNDQGEPLAFASGARHAAVVREGELLREVGPEAGLVAMSLSPNLVANPVHSGESDWWVFDHAGLQSRAGLSASTALVQGTGGNRTQSSARRKPEVVNFLTLFILATPATRPLSSKSRSTGDALAFVPQKHNKDSTKSEVDPTRQPPPSTCS